MNKLMIKDIPINERPRERFIKYGVNNISNEDLLSIILRTGTKNISVKDLSNKILSSYKDIRNLKETNINTLSKIEGVGKVKAITLLSAIELGKRVYTSSYEEKIYFNQTNKIFDYFKDYFLDKKQEYFIALYLDSKKALIDKKILFKGTLNKSLIHPREIFKYAYLLSASSIICVHNHPSGDPAPSKEDIFMTKNLVEISKIQGIDVIDHIIIGNNKYYSFYENGDI